MLLQRIHVEKGAYYDSVTLMLVARELQSMEGIEEASLNMATEANLKILAAAGFGVSDIQAGQSDLLIAVRGDGSVLEAAIEKARELLKNPPGRKSTPGEYRPKSLDGALSMLPEANMALISIAGRYAGDEADKCLDAGLHVMLYSDNVPIEKEISLKNKAKEKGLLVMGPDCGTAVIRGVGLGFANACPTGPVGLVAAAGTGLQEVHVQLARRGVGVLHAIGTGGRDVKEEVGGITFSMGLEALLCDEEIRVVVLIGKPPAPSVEGRILRILEDGKKPAAVGFIGGKASGDKPPLYLCRELEETAAVAAALANGKDPSSAREGLFKSYERLKEKAAPMKRKGFIRGLYSGGTLCYEAQLIATGLIGSVYSNAPLASEMKLADSLKSRGHTMVDYGEDEFTQGRLHPMMDSTFRAERLLSESQDPDVGVILFDCVLGYGCHPNPAGQMAEAVEKARKKAGGRIAYVAYVCGVDADPQGAAEQRKMLEEAGVTVCDSNAEAARLACYIVG